MCSYAPNKFISLALHALREREVDVYINEELLEENLAYKGIGGSYP